MSSFWCPYCPPPTPIKCCYSIHIILEIPSLKSAFNVNILLFWKESLLANISLVLLSFHPVSFYFVGRMMRQSHQHFLPLFWCSFHLLLYIYCVSLLQSFVRWYSTQIPRLVAWAFPFNVLDDFTYFPAKRLQYPFANINNFIFSSYFHFTCKILSYFLHYIININVKQEWW